MRKLLVSAALVASMATGATAFAATTPKPVKAAASSTKASCMKQWAAQKKHTETKKAFLAACEKA